MCGIYKIENLINGKVYIGKSIDIDNRIRNHKSESFNSKSNAYDTAIHRAIRKYGVDNFSFEIVEECGRVDLNQKEQYWIDCYDAFENGYNMTLGGEGRPMIDEVAIYDLWDDGLSIAEISEKTGHTKHTIILILKEYSEYNNKESYKRGRDNTVKKTGKQILQYDLFGNFINKYQSISEAAKKTSIKRINIVNCLCGKQLSAGDYQWIYDGETPPCCYDAQSTNKQRKIVQFDLYGNYIKTFPSAIEAAKTVGLKQSTSIIRCCKNKQETSAGFMWKYCDDDIFHDMNINTRE
jgi:group I intron endonuclease